MKPSASDIILYSFRNILNLSADMVKYVGKTIPFPKFERETLYRICVDFINIVRFQGSLIELETPITIVGDIHGNIHDLLRILVSSNKQPPNKFLFLGDYVDRGKYSIEVVALLFALAINKPHSYYLIRGNHEFESINSKYGFKDEIIQIYGNDDELYNTFNEAFSYFPFAAQVNQTILCLHGGLSVQLQNVEQIRAIKLPVASFVPENEEDTMISDILWSDPSDKTGNYMISQRGYGIIFGVKLVSDFFASSGIKRLIRGHNCVTNGIKTQFDGKVITVFSSSYYNDEENKAAFLYIDEETLFHHMVLSPHRYTPRHSANFIDQESPPYQSSEPLAIKTSLSQIHFRTTNIRSASSGCTHLNPGRKPVQRRRMVHHILSCDNFSNFLAKNFS